VIVANDRTGAIRQSLRDVERTMLLSIVLVVMVVFLFLGTAAPRWCRAWRCHFR
jgi:multidrug efflux pump subunit AcrB